MRIHFIAIGGSVMHDLAIILAKKGNIVTGSDDYIYEPSRSRLEKNHLLPSKLGWFPEKISNDIDQVILGANTKKDNPELLKAKELNLAIYSYPEFVYLHSKDKTRVVIGGSHGKTTITAMIMHVLKTLNRHFDYLIDAQFESFESRVELSSDAAIIIIEGDEHVASIDDQKPKMLIYKPNIALVSGIKWGNDDPFLSFEDYQKQFELFIESIEEKGTLVYNKEDADLQKLVYENKSNINKHGYRIPEYTINKGKTYINTHFGDIPVQIIGRHNLSNIAAAYSVCEWLGIGRPDFYAAIQTFKGASRMLEYVDSGNNRIVYQDFAHSPIKVKKAIKELKEQYPDKELITVLELPIQNILNKSYLNEYEGALDQTDISLVFVDQEGSKNNIDRREIESLLKDALKTSNINVIQNIVTLQEYVQRIFSFNKNLLFINYNNFGGINIANMAELFISSEE